MSFNIEQLTGKGAFTGAPVKKTIKWKSGGEEHEAEVYVRLLSYYSAVSDIFSTMTNKDSVAGRIASSIVDENGKPVFKLDDITGEAAPDRGPLCESLTRALLSAIGEVNSPKKPEGQKTPKKAAPKRRSPRKKRSGTN